MPITNPKAKLQARRRGVTPPRSCRSSGRKILHRINSRTDPGTSTFRWDALRRSLGCGRAVIPWLNSLPAQWLISSVLLLQWFKVFGTYRKIARARAHQARRGEDDEK